MDDRLLRVPEVARALDLDGKDVYALIERGELKAGKGSDGLVYVPERSLQDFLRRRATAPR